MRHPERRRHAAWLTIARKEIADTVSSVRFLLVVGLIALTAVAAVQAASSTIRDAAPAASETPAVFLRLFTVAPEDLPAFFSFFGLVGLLGPLLGIAFGFDAINGERDQRTLPRLVAQPVYRDDVVNGKFAAGLSIIGLLFAVLTLLVTGLGIVRLGLRPDVVEAARLVAYLVVALLYAGAWLALAILCSIRLRRTATAALAAIACWLVFTIFWSLIAGLGADTLADAGEEATRDQLVRNVRLELTIDRFSPQTLYEEASTAVLTPDVRTLDVLLPEQVDRAVPGELGLTQSLLVAAPQTIALLAIVTILFLGAYVSFMREEVRA